MTVETVETVSSADGTAIAYECEGAGPVVVIALGAFNDRRSGVPLAAALRSRFTVCRYDRRGRGDSGDSESYAVERELEDLDAILAAVGGPVRLYGHSSGAILALQAAARGASVAALAVYEPPYTGPGRATPRVAGELREMVASGDRGGAVAAFMALTGAPGAAVEGMRASPAWPRLEALAHTLAYDVTLAGDGVVPASRVSEIAAPVLALAGGASPPWGPEGARAIAAAARRGQAHVFDGQTHAIAPEVLAPVLAEFFTDAKSRQ